MIHTKLLCRPLKIEISQVTTPLSKAIFIASTSSWKPATRYRPSDVKPARIQKNRQLMAASICVTLGVSVNNYYLQKRATRAQNYLFHKVLTVFCSHQINSSSHVQHITHSISRLKAETVKNVDVENLKLPLLSICT